MTLTEAAIGTKHWVKFAGIFGVIALIMWLIFLFLYNNVYKPYTKSKVQAEAKFGKIQKPHFPASIVSSAGLTYSLDTASGSLPGNFPILINVYFIPPQETTFLAPDRAKKLAESLKFTSD